MKIFIKIIKIVFILLLLAINCIESDDHLNTDDSTWSSSPPSVDDKWIETFDQFFKYMRHISETYLPLIEKSLLAVNVSESCSKTIHRMFTNTDEEWVIAMLDSSAGLPGGLLSGTITSYGDYDQCLATSALIDDSMPPVRGKYCFMNIRPPLPPVGETLNLSGSVYESTWINERVGKYARMYARIASGVCIPSVCDETEVTALLRNVFSDFQFTITVEHCSQSDGQSAPDWAQLLAITSVTLCIIAVIIGTYFDECFDRNNNNNNNNNNEKNIRKIFQCFSFTANARRVFTITDGKGGESELQFLHGLRVLSILWVILCHTTNFAPLGLYDQPMIAARFKTDGVEVIKHLWTQLIISGSLSVQTFFIISGLISLHTALKYNKSSKVRFSYGQYVLLRWLRFAPPLFGMFCYQFIWPMLGSGPMFHQDFIRYGHAPCYNNWVPSFLFISNWWPLVDQCASQTWYLSADFQINLISYFVVIYYFDNYSNAIKLNVWTIGAGILLPTVINYIYQIPLVHILDPDAEKLSLSFNMIEFNTYNHFMAYFTGVLLAGVINRGTKIQLSNLTKNILWTVVLALVFVTPFSTYPFIQLDDIPASNLTLLYTSVKRVVWVACIAWVIIACATFDRNCFVSKFLSAKIFQPFSRLTFSIYLTQSLVVWYHGYQSRHLYPIDHYNALFRVGGVAMFSLIFGFILHILFEAPSVNLSKLLFTAKPVQRASSVKEVNNNEEKQTLSESKPHMN